MKGEDKALGYTWDYRDYGARNPQAYNDPKLFEEYRRQDKPEYLNLTWLHSGTKDTKIRQGERKNEELALNVADGLMSFVNPNPRTKAAVRAGIRNLENIRPTVTGRDPLLAGAGNIRIPVNGNVAKGDRIPDTALATTEHKYKGGAHSETKKPTNDGLDSHHCPAKDCYKGAPISSEQGPAIKMDPKDHRLTESYGRSPYAIQYRAKQKELLEQGKLKEAIEMDVRDIRSKFGSKYDKAIEEMLEYSGKLDPNSFKTKK